MPETGDKTLAQRTSRLWPEGLFSMALCGEGSRQNCREKTTATAEALAVVKKSFSGRTDALHQAPSYRKGMPSSAAGRWKGMSSSRSEKPPPYCAGG